MSEEIYSAIAIDMDPASAAALTNPPQYTIFINNPQFKIFALFTGMEGTGNTILCGPHNIGVEDLVKELRKFQEAVGDANTGAEASLIHLKQVQFDFLNSHGFDQDQIFRAMQNPENTEIFSSYTPVEIIDE